MKHVVLYFTLAFMVIAATACGTQRRFSDGRPTNLSYVVDYKLLGDFEIEDVSAHSDTGFRLFAPRGLSKRNGGTLVYFADSKISFPMWVDVLWREMPEPGAKDYTGKPVGPFRVNVLDRIQKEAIELARSRPGKNMLVLRFRIKEDGVLFGWMVREEGRVPHITLMSGGDFN